MHSSRQIDVLWGGINITQEVLNVQSAISSPTCAATSNCTEFVQWVSRVCTLVLIADGGNLVRVDSSMPVFWQLGGVLVCESVTSAREYLLYDSFGACNNSILLIASGLVLFDLYELAVER